MADYRTAGQDFYFPDPLPELEPFEHHGPAPDPVSRLIPPPQALIARARGWVAGDERDVETWSAPPGILLKVSGVSDFYITSAGILRSNTDQEITQTDRDTLMGPALMLALALSGVWCLHASAAMFNEQVTAFMGESGQGKSTLAESLSRADWRLVADDILPIIRDQAGVQVHPHFPQLKLTVQPGLSLAEQIPLHRICVLAQAEHPELRQLSTGEALQALLRHTAGTRLFDPSLLAGHMAFCAWAAARIPVYHLAYPRTWEALPQVKVLLENLC
jgi:hypothetical protein